METAEEQKFEHNILRRNSGSAKDAVFGVLYTLSKEKEEPSWKWSVFEVLVHFLQLAVILIAPHFSWDFNGSTWAMALMETDITSLLGRIGYTAFAAIFWTQVSFLFVSVLICCWVGYSFKTSHFPYVWPIRVVRVFVSLFVRTIYIMALAVFLMSMRCSSSEFFFYQSRACNELPHLPAVITAAPSALILIVLAFLTVAAESQLDPFADDLLSVSFSQTTLRVFIADTVLDALDVFLGGTSHRSTLAALLFPLFLGNFVLHVLNAPNVNRAANYLKAGLSGLLLWFSFMLLVLELSVGSAGSTSPHARPISVACEIGILPACALAVLSMHLRLLPSIRRGDKIAAELEKHTQHALRELLASNVGRAGIAGRMIPKGPFDVLRQLNSILNDEEAFRALPPLPDTRMASPLEAELVARCMRRHDRNGNVQEAFLAAALVVLRDSVKRFPKSARLRVLYGNFLLSTLQNPQQAGEQFAAVRKMKSNFDIQFQVFCRGREQTQSSTGGASTEGAMDLVQFVEYQNSLRAVQRNQASAMHAIKSFWAELLSTESTTLTQLSWTLRSLSALEMRAHKLYRIMLERYPANASLMRLYASFLAGVRCAPGRALRMYGKADSLEDAQADAKQGAVVGLGMASKDDAVIMINEVGIIQYTNRALNNMFGWQNGELVGMNINVLMPQPYSSQHNGYLAQFQRRRTSKLVGKSRLFIGLKKDGSPIPIMIMVSHFIQDGSDRFVACVTQADVDPTKCLVYTTLEGNILSVSRGFSMTYGWLSAEVSGKPVQTLSDGNIQLERALTAIRDAMEEARASMSGNAKAALRKSVADPMMGSRGSLMPALHTVASGMDTDLTSRKSRPALMREALTGFQSENARDRRKLSSVLPPLTSVEEDGDKPESLERADQLASPRGRRAMRGHTVGGHRSLLVKKGSLQHITGLRVREHAPRQSAREELIRHVEAEMQHKYLKKTVKIRANFSIVGESRHTVLEILVEMDEDPTGVLACTREGKLVHISASVEEALGYPGGTLVAASATVGHLLPFGQGRFHRARLSSALLAGGRDAPHIPCKMGQIVLLRGNQGAAVPAVLSWSPQRVGTGGKPVYVCKFERAPHDPTLSVWGFRSIVDQTNTQRLLRVIVSSNGAVVAAGHGFGYSGSKVPGGVFGINARTMVGTNCADHVDILGAVVKVAKKFSEGISVEDVMGRVLSQIGEVCANGVCTAFRGAMLCPPAKGRREPDRVPVRLSVVPLRSSRVNVSALSQGGAIPADMLEGLRADGYVVDIWSANWVTSELSISHNGIVKAADLLFEVLSGMSASRVLGKHVSSLLEDGPEGGKDGIRGLLMGKKMSVEARLKHVDGSLVPVLALGQGETPGERKRRMTLVLRGVIERAEPETEALHRMQVILDRAMGTHETHKKEPAVTDDAKEASGSTSFIGEVEHATTNVPGGSLREVSPPVVSESGQESRRKDGGAGESDSESDKDSEFAEEDLVASIARQANDETQSQGVGRAQFRVSKTFKATYDSLKKSRLMLQLSRLIPSIQGILFLCALLHIVLFVLMTVLVVSAANEIDAAAVSGRIYVETVQLPSLARRAQDAGAGGYWSSVSDLATLQSEMAFVVTDLIDGARKEYALGPMQSTELREALVEGITYTRLRDVDLGDGLGGRDVTPGETRTRGMLRLTNLLTASADRVTLMPAEELATADRDSRHWRWVVEGAQDPFLPEQSLLLGESYTEALQHLGRIESWVLVLGLIQAVVLMPISVAVSLMRIRRLVRAKKRLFSIFLGVPRPVLYTMAASAATVEGVGEGGQNGAKDLSATLSEDEKRAAKRLEKGKGTGKGIERLLRFEEPRQELKADTWRLQALVVIPLGVMTLICLATHLIAYFFLSKAEFPIGALETVFRVRVRTARVKFFANELATMAHMGSDVNLWNVSRQDIADSLNESVELLAEQWASLLFGGADTAHDGITSLSDDVEKAVFSRGCLRADASECYPEGHPWHPLTSEGLNQTMQSFVVEAQVFAGQPEEEADPSSGRFWYLWDVGTKDVAQGIERVGNLLIVEAEHFMNIALFLEGCLIALMLTVQCWLYWVLKPEVRAGKDEVKWAAQMLSRLPEKMGAYHHLKRELNLRDAEDNISSEYDVQETLLGRIRRKYREAVKRYALGPEYQGYLEYKAWRQAQGIPIAEAHDGTGSRVIGALRRIFLRPMLGGTFEAWKRLDEVYRRRKSGMEQQGREHAAHESLHGLSGASVVGKGSKASGPKDIPVGLFKKDRKTSQGRVAPTSSERMHTSAEERDAISGMQEPRRDRHPSRKSIRWAD